MAKVSFTKLGLKINQNVKSIAFNDQVIEVKQYLPINNKLELISNVINLSADDNNFANPVKIHVFTTLEVIEQYTNINFTEKQKEDPTKLFDLLESSGLSDLILETIPKAEYTMIVNGVNDSTEAVYNYRNSVLGILESVSADYSAIDLDATELQKKIGDPDNLALLKQVLTKLG